jgi:hypothetical protein
VGFALEQPLHVVALAYPASGILKQLEYIGNFIEIKNGNAIFILFFICLCSLVSFVRIIRFIGGC